MYNMKKSMVLLLVVYLALAEAGPVKPKTFYESLVGACPQIGNMSEFANQTVIKDCKDGVQELETLHEFSMETAEEVLCLLYYNSVQNACNRTKNLNRAQLIPDLSTINVNVCQAFTELGNLTNGILNGSSCETVCNLFPKMKPFFQIPYLIYKAGQSKMSEANVEKVSQAQTASEAVQTPVADPKAQTVKLDSKPSTKLEASTKTMKKVPQSVVQPELVPKPQEISNPAQSEAVHQSLDKKVVPLNASIITTTKVSETEHKSERKPESEPKSETVHISASEPNNNNNKPLAADPEPEIPKQETQSKPIEVSTIDKQQVSVGANNDKTVADTAETKLVQPDADPDQDMKQADPDQEPKPLDNADVMEPPDLISPKQLNEEEEFARDDPETDYDAPPDMTVEKGPEKSKVAIASNISNDDMDGESDFFSYFMAICLMVVLGYVGYHNRQKLFALMIEGKRGKRQYRGRRPNSANYHKLDSNLEEAISSECSKSTSHIIY